MDLRSAQLALLDSLEINIVEKWVVSFTGSAHFANAKLVLCKDLFENLERFIP